MSKSLVSMITSLKELPCFVELEKVVFPGETGIVDVKSNVDRAALDYADIYQGDDKFVLCIYKNLDGSWQKYGVVSRVVQKISFDDHRSKVMLQPITRVKIEEPYKDIDNTCWLVDISCISKYPQENDDKLISVLRKSWSSFLSSTKANNFGSETSLEVYDNLEDVAFRILTELSIPACDKARLLNIENSHDLVKEIMVFLECELESFEIEERLTEEVRAQMEKDNRNHILNIKKNILQKELGKSNTPEEDYRSKINDLKLSEVNQKKVELELNKLESTPSISPEHSLIQHYMNWVCEIPWGKYKPNKVTFAKAKKILDRDHYGLEKTKDRILESIAVQSRTASVSGNILCLMGPPGVGKTSVGRSIAEATGRSFVRISLGGMKDVSEIMGHRKTYVGSMPGKIIKALKSAGNMNPCILLDEIDKLGSDFRGDPSSALLEVLDPEQNSKFNDHFMDLDIDLSKVLFITTANTYNIAGPLLDRMEVIELSGYTDLEKTSIAQKYLIPKSLKAHGLSGEEIKIKKQAIQSIIRLYTKESGVRELERMFDKISRKRVREIMEKKDYSVEIGQESLQLYLGTRVYDEEQILKKPMVGVVQGLAWTSVGGALLNIESLCFPGGGKLQNTGSLGEVMLESIQAAISVTRTIGMRYKFDESFYDNQDLHIHLPEGATPKDGPSAGITLCTALISMITKVPVRSDVAMTGELNLRGGVMAIGGLKEKLLAALQSKIKTVIIPKENQKDLSEMPKEIINGLDIQAVETIDQVISIALTKKLTARMWPKKKKESNAKKD